MQGPAAQSTHLSLQPRPPTAQHMQSTQLRLHFLPRTPTDTSLLKRYTSSRENYISFLENVVLEFYGRQLKDNTYKLEEEKEKQLIRTK